MIKIKGLLPSLREHNRYVSFDVISNKKHDYKSVSNEIISSCKNYLGELGLANAGVMLISNKWNSDQQKGIIKTDRRYADHVRASLALIRKINNTKAIVRSLNVSGILKKAG